jgi:hypothetical protein
LPANRSRTERWRDCLDQIRERGGFLEFSLSRPDESREDAPAHGADLVWRCRLLDVGLDSMFIEQPQTLGEPIRLLPGSELVGVMSIGQNRWNFRTKVVESSVGAGADRRVSVIRLSLPKTMDRVQRREFYRMSTAGVQLPTVSCWPLLNQSSAVAAEVATRAMAADAAAGRSPSVSGDDPGVLPEVGPMFTGLLANVGGGGIGLIVPHTDASRFDRARCFWLRIDLTPDLKVPIGVVARVAHTHLDSALNVYAGLSFDFSHHREHRDFVIEQIAEYVAVGQRQGRRAA